MRSPNPSRGLVALLVALALQACAPVWYGADVVWVHRSPPPPRREFPPEIVGDGWVWMPGYWYWTGMTFVWRPGLWSRPPIPGHVWVRDGWVHHGGRYQYIPGRWSRPERAPRHIYVPRPWPRAYRPVRWPRPARPRHQRRESPRPGERPQSELADPRRLSWGLVTMPAARWADGRADGLTDEWADSSAVYSGPQPTAPERALTDVSSVDAEDLG